jgi:hypothetical protein
METKVIVMFAILHGSAIVLGTCLVVRLAHSTPGAASQDSEGSDGGEGPLHIPPSPSPSGGGLPLPDSRAARVRLREPIQPGALWARPARRPHPEIDPRPAPAKRPLRLSGAEIR